MMNKIDNILIGLLWLLAVTLASTFWFNTMFGFNLFSSLHWHYVAKLQATGNPIVSIFYISVVVIVLVAVLGLYLLLQPRFRRITMPTFDRTQRPQVPSTPASPISPSSDIQPAPETVAVTQPVAESDVSEQKISTTPPTTGRPPRLNIPTPTRTATVPRVPLAPTPQQKINPETEYADIRAIFESAGYVYKGSPRIKNVQTALVAIGTDEVLWIGAVGVKNTDMQRAVQTLAGVFTDTLEDIEIHIHAFIIAAPDTTDTNNDILQFATVDDLRNYINGVPNTPLDADESENFDAYSAYIGTVMDYVGKI